MTTAARIPLAIPDLRGRELELLTKCVRDNWVSSAGPEVLELEHSMAQLTGRAHAVATVNGTAALHLALLGLGIRPGDRVIVPDWTFAATANAVAHAGATPVFVDVTASDWALDAGLVAEAIEKDPGIRAVMAVDPIGHAADMDALIAVCGQAGIPLIEDAAGGIGGRYKDRPCGSFGQVSTFSFNGNKTVTAGGGGMLLTDDAAIAQRVRHRSTQARPAADYVHDEVGYNYRMTNINAAVGLAQLERLDEMVAAKRAIATRYDASLSSRNDIQAMPRPSHSHSACWLYCVQVAGEEAAQSLVSACADANIEARVFWRSLSAQKPWQSQAPHLRGVSAKLSGTIVSLPCSSSLTEEQQSRVLDVLSAWSGPAMEREAIGA
jgi:dTDP-4-amino-4,6-dideoxygalactose transaminase